MELVLEEEKMGLKQKRQQSWVSTPRVANQREQPCKGQKLAKLN